MRLKDHSVETSVAMVSCLLQASHHRRIAALCCVLTLTDPRCSSCVAQSGGVSGYLEDLLFRIPDVHLILVTDKDGVEIVKGNDTADSGSGSVGTVVPPLLSTHGWWLLCFALPC
jgi:hypothetical protein